MSLNLSVKSLDAAMRKLKAAANKGPRHCAHCREHGLRSSWIDPLRPLPQPKDLVTIKCEFCHSVYFVNIAGNPEVERELFRLSVSITVEDIYRDPKVRTTALWLRHFMSAWRKREKRRKARMPDDAENEKIHLSSSTRRRVDMLCVEAANLAAHKNRILIAKYGKMSFTKYEELVAQVRDQADNDREPCSHAGVNEIEAERLDRLICAGLEKLIWGEPRPDTISAIAKLEREIDELRDKSQIDADSSEHASEYDSLPNF